MAKQANILAFPACLIVCIRSAANVRSPVHPTQEPSLDFWCPSPKAMASKSITFSIVDDDSDLRDSIVRYLTVKGGFVCAGQYGRAQDALANLPAEKPSVVLMDIKMKGMDGIECVRRLKERMPDILIIMLT